MKEEVPEQVDGIWKYYWNTNHISVYMGFNEDETMYEGDEMPKNPY